MSETILFVDDEPNVLAAFKRQLRTQFTIETANNGREALDMVAVGGPYAVIVSDLRMPGMDGIQFLSQARDITPESSRILLTGHADLTTAIDAINEGRIFRFLTKPCTPEALTEAIKAGLEQYRLVTAERELLEKTLSKTVNLLTDMLSLANPVAFGRAVRLRRIVKEIAANLHLAGAWQFELAAMLSQTGCVTLPASLLEKVHSGQPLSKEEESLYASHPMIGFKLLEPIPRLGLIASMVRDQERTFASYASQPYSHKTYDIDLGAQILKVALGYDQLTRRGLTHAEAVQTMLNQPELYNSQVVEALGSKEIAKETWVMKVVGVAAVEQGMVFNEDIYTRDGKLLISKGMEVNLAILEHLTLMAKSVGVVEPFRVLVPPQVAASSS